jgi:hypothetical protein
VKGMSIFRPVTGRGSEAFTLSVRASCPVRLGYVAGALRSTRVKARESCVPRLGIWPLALVLLAGLTGCTMVAGCGSAATAMPMPTEIHHLPTVLGPLTGTGNETFTIVARPTMALELGCTGKGLARVRSPVGGFAVQCYGTPGTFGVGYTSTQGMARDRVKAGQRISVRVTAPAGDTWQLWITGGAASPPF